MNIGNLELSRISTPVFSDCGQCSGSPSGEADQSKRRIRSPISPPSAKKARPSQARRGSGEVDDIRRLYSTHAAPAGGVRLAVRAKKGKPGARDHGTAAAACGL